jgi:predicted Zn finger-like uncharacterized protein
MIITCTSCLTKFNLDDSRIHSQGAKVRCSRCRHVFHVASPQETKERVEYGDYHEELTTPGQIEPKLPLQIEEEQMKEPLLSEKAPPVEREAKEKQEKEEGEKKQGVKGKAFTAKKTVRKERKSLSLFFILVVIVVLLLFAAFYLVTALGSGGHLLPSLQSPVRKIAEFIHQIF